MAGMKNELQLEQERFLDLKAVSIYSKSDYKTGNRSKRFALVNFLQGNETAFRVKHRPWDKRQCKVLHVNRKLIKIEFQWILMKFFWQIKIIMKDN